MGENIYKHCNQQGLNFQNIQNSNRAQQQKNKQPNQKMGRRPKWTRIQRRYTDDKQTHEKMPHITNHQRNGNQN